MAVHSGDDVAPATRADHRVHLPVSNPALACPSGGHSERSTRPGIGGCENDEFRAPSRQLMERSAPGEMTLVPSAVTLQKLEGAPKADRDVLRAVRADNLEVTAITGESNALADRHVVGGALGWECADAQDIAAATVSGVGVLPCWSLRRMVNLSRIRQHDEVNRRMTYPPVEIQSPMELENED